MAYTGFNFRTSPTGGTGFPGDGSNAFVSPTAAYNSSSGYGYEGGLPGGSQNFNGATDGRLAGGHSISSGNASLAASGFRVDVPNGPVDIILAASGFNTASNEACRIFFGAGLSDYIDVVSGVVGGSGTITSVPNGSQMDATGNIVTNSVWSGTPAPVRVTVKNGFLKFVKGSAIFQPRHIAYQAAAAPLQVATIDTDDTGVVINTTGTTSASSASVTGLSVAGVAPGMNVSGPNIPAGVTVATVGAMNASGIITSLTLSTGTGVTAGTAALKFGWPPMLFEKQPIGKVIAPFNIAVGPQQVANFAVTLADGVTPHPHIGIKLADPQESGYPVLCFYHITSIFTADGPTHTFKLVQATTDPTYSGSPYVSTFTLPVTFAPTKPTTGILSLISTGAFLKRSTILTKFSAAWKGYRGQVIYQSATVSRFADLASKMSDFAALAGGGKWFSILLDPAGDWTTSVNGNGVSYDFKPWEGGGLIIANATLAPLLKGGFYTKNQRGVQWGPGTSGKFGPGLIWTGGIPEHGGASLRMDPDTSKPLTITVISGNKFGALHDPANTDASVAAASDNVYGGPAVAIKIIRGADQVTSIGNDFFGCGDAHNIHAAHLFEGGWNSFRRIYGDCYPVAAGGLTYAFTEANVPVSDQSSWMYIHDDTAWANIDNPKNFAVSADGSSLVNVPHPDYIQLRAPDGNNGETQQLTTWLLVEGVATHSNAIDYNTNDGDVHRLDVNRQSMIIDSGNSPRHSCIIHNIGCTSLVLGIEESNVIDGFVEYNTLAGAARLPPSGPSGKKQFYSTPRLYCQFKTPGRKRFRKNVYTSGGYFSAALGSASEDNIKVNWDGSAPLPGTAFVGTFKADTADTASSRQIYDFPADALTSTARDVRKATWAMFKPLGDAGAQAIRHRLVPGDTDTLTVAQAATLVAVTDAQPVGALPGTVSLRWNSGPGETGVQTGSDVTFSVQ